MKLLEYKFINIVCFGDGEYKTVYNLTLLKSYFFGLIKKQITITYDISMFGSISEHQKHWDSLIESGEKISI